MAGEGRIQTSEIFLPTILKCSETVRYGRKVLNNVEVECVSQPTTSVYYKASESNRKVLGKDTTCQQAKHADIFITAKPIFEMPRMPNTESNRQPPVQNANQQTVYRQNNPPGTYYYQSNQPPPNQAYVYYPNRRVEPQDTRDLGPYRERSRNLRQRSDDYIFDKQIRKQFVFKVYLILSLLLLFAFGMCLMANLILPMRMFFVRYYWICYIFMIVYFILSITLTCFASVRRTFPINMILLVLMVASITMCLCVITALYSTRAVLYSLGTTVLITITVTMVAKYSPFDVTGCGMLVCILLIAFSLYALITFIISLFIYSPLMELIFGAIGTILFSFFLFFDTQQILGGRRVELSPEEYILAIILLFTDILMIFLLLLNVYSYSD